MKRIGKILLGVGAVGAAAGALAWSWPATPAVEAADHLDPPMRTDPATAGGSADRNADIADLYAWHQGTGADAKMVAVLTFAGPNDPAAGQATPCDRDVLYGIHMNNGTTTSDIYARFGKDDVGNCFVNVTGIPGTGGGGVAGPIERPFTRGDVKVFAGLRDDPFFFDLTGFRQTLMTGTLSMINDRDFFAGKNSSAIVIQFPLSAVSPAGEVVRVWSTTGRAGGGA
jgi:hypothetical protein